MIAENYCAVIRKYRFSGWTVTGQIGRGADPGSDSFRGPLSLQRLNASTPQFPKASPAPPHTSANILAGG